MPEQLDDAGEVIEPEEPVELTAPLETVKPENWAFRVCPGECLIGLALPFSDYDLL